MFLSLETSHFHKTGVSLVPSVLPSLQAMTGLFSDQHEPSLAKSYLFRTKALERKPAIKSFTADMHVPYQRVTLLLHEHAGRAYVYQAHSLDLSVTTPFPFQD